ncbi:MAG: serine/threonine protein phosphatase [Rhodopirellula sp.]|nr:serine/threonine protein phosphatase [Rhodopirellula sp.]OUX50211.1 MAG: serine/threonine protein phosphatase [Rhodopirellula sp. TMED283]
MKFLCFSDLHRNGEAAAKLVELSQGADVVIGAGDFATRREGVEDTLEVLSSITKPAILVPGNGESASELEKAVRVAKWKSAMVLHGTGCVFEGVEFWGVGGGIPVTPFGDWSYDFSEAEAGPLLAGCKPDSVLVVHSPPLDTVDHDSTGQIRGSQAIREVVETVQPKLVVCGHIHSDWEKQCRIAKTQVLNAGPRGVLIEIDVTGD